MTILPESPVEQPEGADTVSAMAEDPRAVRQRLLEFALTFPEAYEDHPWEDDLVVKVRKKIFVFLGSEDQESHSMGVKLPVSRDEALLATGAKPSGYGLGRSGWVSVPLDPGPEDPGLLEDWIEESYRTVAPKRLSATLDQPNT